MECPSCHNREARQHPVYGVLPCKDCTESRRHNALPGSQVEFTVESIKNDRRQYAKTILQPFRDGTPSKEFAEAFPDKAEEMFKGHGKPEYVWQEEPNMQNLELTE